MRIFLRGGNFSGLKDKRKKFWIRVIVIIMIAALVLPSLYAVITTMLNSG